MILDHRYLHGPWDSSRPGATWQFTDILVWPPGELWSVEIFPGGSIQEMSHSSSQISCPCSEPVSSCVLWLDSLFGGWVCASSRILLHSTLLTLPGNCMFLHQPQPSSTPVTAALPEAMLMSIVHAVGKTHVWVCGPDAARSCVEVQSLCCYQGPLDCSFLCHCMGPCCCLWVVLILGAMVHLFNLCTTLVGSVPSFSSSLLQ